MQTSSSAPTAPPTVSPPVSLPRTSPLRCRSLTTSAPAPCGSTATTPSVRYSCWMRTVLTLDLRRRRALRWLQAVRHRPRARRVRPPPVLRDQDRHHQCDPSPSFALLRTDFICRAAQAHRPYRVHPLNGEHNDAISAVSLSASKRMRDHSGPILKCDAGYFPVSAWQALSEARW